ncbi:MAG TPA: hypothetical protein P5137_06850, partial [Candidatus Brocadiia bacterium]|nr:hypothetical protein [Candidatus Brocadiia bacterium]
LVLAAFLAKSVDAAPLRHWDDATGLEQARVLLGQMAAWTAAQPDGASLCARLLEPLSPASYQRLPATDWNEAPPEARLAAIATLAKVSDPACAADVARFLAGLLRCDGRYGKPLAQTEPDLSRAIEFAREQVMTKGSPADQTQVLVGAAQSMDGKLRAGAAAEIQRRLLAGQVADSLVPHAVQALTQSADQLTPEFLDFALDSITKATANPALGFSLQELLINAARTCRTQEPRQSWLDKAAAFFADKVSNPDVAAFDRQRALSIYGRAAVDGSVAVKARLLDEKEDQNVRITAAEMITEVDPTTTAFKELAQEAVFTKLPRELQQRAAQVAARSRETPGAEDLVIIYLKTKPPQDRQWQLQNVLYTLQLPETPALRAAVEALVNDPHAGNGAKHVLRQLWRHRDVPEGGAPATTSYDKLLAGLKEAAWKKEDPIEKSLTWYGLKPGLAVADSQAKTVTRNAGLLGDDKTTVTAIAFEPRRVWLGTDRGLIAWDRKAKFYSRMAVSADLFDAPVVSLEMKDAALRAVVQTGKDKTQTWLFDTAKGKWTQEGGK